MASIFFTKAKEITKLIWYEENDNCRLCGKKSIEAVCQSCREEYFRTELRRCVSCGKLTGNEFTHCQDCQAGKGPKGLSKVTAVGYYDGAWKEFIHNIKYKGQPYLLIALTDYLTSWAVKQLPPPDMIVPVPLHPNRLAQRGFNQAEVLASILGRNLGISVQDNLVRFEDTRPQISFGRYERINNIRNAFGLKPHANIAEKIIWLVDDVITTGATIDECARILRNNKAKAIYAFCLGAGKEGY